MNNISKIPIKQFIENELGCKINPETVFFEDIPIDGLDIDIFMIQIAEYYEVDMSTFVPEDYGISEKDISNVFITIARGLFNRKALLKKSFTLDHLCLVIAKGVWFEPNSNHE